MYQTKLEEHTVRRNYNKVKTVMKEYKKGQLNIGKSSKKVKSKKQAVAIAMSEAGMAKKKKKKGKR
jgi:hypothetical protein